MKLLISFVFLAATAFGQYAGSSFVVLANGTMTYRDTSSPANTAVFEAPTTISTNYVAVLPTNGGSVGTALVVNSQSCAGTPTVCTDQLAWSGSVACTDCMVTTGGQTVTGTDTFSAAQIFSGGLEIADSMGNTVTFAAPSATFSSSYTLYLPVNPPGTTGQALVLEPLSNSQLEWGTCGGCLTTAGGQTISGSDTWNANQTYGGNILFSTNNTYNVGSAVDYAANVYSYDVNINSTLSMPSGGGTVTMGIGVSGQSATVDTGTCALTFVYGWLTSSSGSCNNPTFGTVTSVATSSPITGGTITTTGTIGCSTCLVTGGGQTISGSDTWNANQTYGGNILFSANNTYEVGSPFDYPAHVYSENVNVEGTLVMPSGGGAVTMGGSNGQSGTVATGTCSLTFVYGWLTASSGSCNNPTFGTVTSIATTGPITGGTITTSGTIACATCVDTTDTFTLQGQYTMGSSSNLYLRTISGAPSCSGVGNGWIGVDTSGLNLDICVGGTLHQIPL